METLKNANKFLHFLINKLAFISSYYFIILIKIIIFEYTNKIITNIKI